MLHLMAHGPGVLNGDTANGALKSGAARLLDVLLPPQCLSCGVVVDEIQTLCATCWAETNFLTPPSCACCGVPFLEDAGGGALCGACLRSPPQFARARAVMVYDQASRRMVLAFKHGDRTDMAPAFAEWMARAGAELTADADLIVPVPLHWTRLFRRRFNQAAMIAQGLGRQAGLDVAPDMLVRKRRTPTQAGLGFAGRSRNVRGAFKVAPAKRPGLKGKRVLLVDDVLTTGATLNACARELRRAGASAVDVLTLARVVRPPPEPE